MNEELRKKGIVNRYKVSKTNGEATQVNAEYFVLRLDFGGRDRKHIESCRKAIMTYAQQVHEHLPKLSEELIDKYGDSISLFDATELWNKATVELDSPIERNGYWAALQDLENIGVLRLSNLTDD